MDLIQQYIAQWPEPQKGLMTQLYQIVTKYLPEASEKISYGMPTFYWHENLVHFAAYKKHIGFYPTPSVIEAFVGELSSNAYSKAAVQFSINEKLPVALIKKMLVFRKKELLKKFDK